ncbi:putative E3 ubiquitin-protein ligase UBR7 [Dunckerocampus dactyliophorus]|uniref:putative E3 ubiquitin-protein ligase UBR7 n=1 Tax=Dunckerocampus dactyliophorus TaxID=161453 RepID=UPI002405623F|nr:putative E3 ubiquitin-protein ligase UBR7 [Dunckerocampus dactyliophorus]
MEAQLDDLLANEEDLESVLCVLAGSDPENCSYSRGYVKRQAVFACNTCTHNAAEPAGICLACANKCHDGHDIFELYTKRNFRCDCGNSKFGDFRCQLIPAKDKENVKNLYSHNFSGCYCTCDRPYPDTDDQVNDEMIQCVVCEDWFHTRHLQCTMVEPEELQEMVCEACMNKAPFLWTYAAHFAVSPEKDEEGDVEGEEIRQDASKIRDEEPSTSLEPKKQEGAETRSFPCKRSHDDMTASPGESKTTACKLKALQAQNAERPRRGAVFWPYSWRSELCTCTSCKRAYVAAQVHFLMDESDSVLAYENRGLDEPFGQHPLMAVTSSMTRVQQLEFIYGYKELTTAITAFLHQCAAEKRVVTPEAVHQLFEELQARKRRRINTGYQ